MTPEKENNQPFSLDPQKESLQGGNPMAQNSISESAHGFTVNNEQIREDQHRLRTVREALGMGSGNDDSLEETEPIYEDSAQKTERLWGEFDKLWNERSEIYINLGRTMEARKALETELYDRWGKFNDEIYEAMIERLPNRENIASLRDERSNLRIDLQRIKKETDNMVDAGFDALERKNLELDPVIDELHGMGETDPEIFQRWEKLRGRT